MMNIMFHSRWHIDKLLRIHLIHRYAVPLPHRGRLYLRLVRADMIQALLGLMRTARTLPPPIICTAAEIAATTSGLISLELMVFTSLNERDEPLIKN